MCSSVFCFQKSKYAVRDRAIEFALQKKEEGPYWERLLKDKTKQHWLKIDFAKWKNEDDSDDENGGGGGGGGGDLEEVRPKEHSDSKRLSRDATISPSSF